jgi:GH25 family lysozyme M1 (1,4-beta-N-acetylmuramidase)
MKFHLFFSAAMIVSCTLTRDMGEQHRALTVCADGETVDGIDVSKFQGDIDWQQVKASGIEYAFIRVSDGLNFPDNKFQQNWDGSKQAGVLRGAYQFFRPTQDPIAQADMFLAAMGELEPGDLPPVIDVEDDDGASPATIATNVGLWLDRVESATGRQPIIYTGKFFWNDFVQTNEFAEYPLWIAQYGPVCPDLPTAWTDWLFFQTSASGSIPGIVGDVDTDLFNGSLADLLAYANATPAVCGDAVCSAGEDTISCEADCPPCGVIAPEGGDIDDGDACFVGGGPAQFLRLQTDAGFGGDLIWTHTTASANEANFAEWQLYFAEAGTYRVEVYTDAAYAESRLAEYRIDHNGVSDFVTLDQTAVSGFQSLGEFTFAAGAGQLIHIGDNTGEPGADNVQLVLDNIKLTRLDLPPGPGPDPDPDPDIDGAPGGFVGSCSVSSPRNDALWFFGLFALLILRRRNK